MSNDNPSESLIEIRRAEEEIVASVPKDAFKAMFYLFSR